MIISHKHKFIFIKTVKTAGTSVEVDLNKVLGPNDIATPIYPEVEGHKAQNYVLERPDSSAVNFKNHMPARQVKNLIGDDIWHSYYKFCVEREPIDKVVSYYSMLVNSPYHNQETKNLSFDEFISQGKFPVDTYKYTDKEGALIVDNILHYENLSDELKSLAQNLGFSLTLQAQAKTGFRINVDVSDGHRDIIYNAFASSNVFTGYKKL